MLVWLWKLTIAFEIKRCSNIIFFHNFCSKRAINISLKVLLLQKQEEHQVWSWNAVSRMSRSFTIMGGITARDQYQPLHPRKRIFIFTQTCQYPFTFFVVWEKVNSFFILDKVTKTVGCVTFAIITLNSVYHCYKRKGK